MSHYCGIDLHSNNHVVVVIDDEDSANRRRVDEVKHKRNRLLNAYALAYRLDDDEGLGKIAEDII